MSKDQKFTPEKERPSEYNSKNENADQPTHHIFKNSTVTEIIDENIRKYKIESEHFIDSVFI